MPTTTLNTLANNIAGLTLSSAYTAGGLVFRLSSGGSLFPPGITPANPCRMTVITAGTYQTSSETLTIYEVTGVSGNTITCSGAIEGTTDQNFAIGDKVDLRLTAGSVNDLNTAVTPVLATAIAAAGSTQAGATAIAAPSFYGSTLVQVVNSVTAGQGVALPALSASTGAMEITVVNATGTACLVYPANSSGNTIDALGANAPTSLTPNGTATFVATSATGWNTKRPPFPNVQVFPTTGINTWTMPAGATSVRVLMVGGGGAGGGGGMQTSATTAQEGGGGGGGGGAAEATFLASTLPATVTVTVGAGGNGGAGATVNGAGTNGGNGLASSFGTYAKVSGGYGGQGAGTGGTSVQAQFVGGAGANSTSTGVPSGGANAGFAASGGGAGGGQSTAGTLYAGSNGGETYAYENAFGGTGGGANTGGVGTAGTVGNTSCSLADTWAPGSGGGGGGAGSGGGGAGGNGGSYGAGGGGGGMGQSVGGGLGGNGGNGVVIVIAT